MKKLLILILLIDNKINSDPTSLLQETRRSQNRNIPLYSPLHSNTITEQPRATPPQIRENFLEKNADCVGYGSVAAGMGCTLTLPIMIMSHVALPITIPIGCVTTTSGVCLGMTGCGILLRDDGE